MKSFARLPRRVKAAVVVAISLLVVVPALQYLMGSSKALDTAEQFLLSNPKVREVVGSDVEVKHPAWFWRSDFGWTPGSAYAEYEFRVVGKKGSMRVRIKLKKANSSEWVVYSATLWTPGGPVAIR